MPSRLTVEKGEVVEGKRNRGDGPREMTVAASATQLDICPSKHGTGWALSMRSLLLSTSYRYWAAACASYVSPPLCAPACSSNRCKHKSYESPHDASRIHLA